ncbi:MAG TPA: helix-hairpin-helix domain-containing protein [Candidatus Kapabacteria bacterium]|nr:helix-hairpin-helix domain-containing protein [Candidatus Kapabacteria bacterium]
MNLPFSTEYGFAQRELTPGRGHPRRPRSGFILIVVLVVVVLASMVALSLLFRMRAEQAAFSASLGSEQAWYTAMSGVQQAMEIAKNRAAEPAQSQNNPGAFFHQLVVDDGSDKWFYTVFTAAPPEEQTVRYGLTDETRKMNLNKATAEMLSKATVLSPQQIQSITGAGLTNVASVADPLSMDVTADLLLGGPVRPHFSTLDELLKLPGFTPGVLYGEDANHNYRLDPNEDDGVLLFPPDDSDGSLFLGLREVATVFTYEFDIAADGSPRFQLNSTNRTVPEFIIPEKTALYIQAAWSNKVIFKTPADLLEAKIKVKEGDKEVEIESGVGPKELPTIFDQLTTTFEARLVGLININTADVKVLRTIPGIGEAKAEMIVQAREGLSGELKQSPAWLFSESVLTAAEFKQAAPHITARSLQFRFNVVGYSMPGGRYRVYEVVIDTADKQPQILYLRDITRFGLPFPLPSADETQELQNVQTQS